ncbi:hypothetical protein M231_03488 [Tremella mesenterica]|uniref:Uncharacterized protein n=1 Tax=Tremella mesenterica TaxID=5217 RepID=A0A4Q1BN42_TREME|nr:uncharacterized protein TREMEDRAFT_58706 [Tremella mesenterica DSM 1558]EIW72534.1 hypothetical protein TREMEDRAFT_58706 [Tremella mesenterica DSM 1558]RXK39268.1 hypothetical protein M231_03488 [Tremella mesenterica]
MPDSATFKAHHRRRNTEPIMSEINVSRPRHAFSQKQQAALEALSVDTDIDSPIIYYLLQSLWDRNPARSEISVTPEKMQENANTLFGMLILDDESLNYGRHASEVVWVGEHRKIVDLKDRLTTWLKATEGSKDISGVSSTHHQPRTLASLRQAGSSRGAGSSRQTPSSEPTRTSHRMETSLSSVFPEQSLRAFGLVWDKHGTIDELYPDDNTINDSKSGAVRAARAWKRLSGLPQHLGHSDLREEDDTLRAARLGPPTPESTGSRSDRLLKQTKRFIGAMFRG